MLRSLWRMQQQKRIRAAMIDLSGTIHIDDVAITGSPQSLTRLRNAGIEVRFVTNTTKEPLRELHERLIKLGFSIDKREIFTSLTAARNLIIKRKLRPLLYLEQSAKEDFAGITQENPDAVVIGLAPDCFNYGPMNSAFRLLLEGAPLIAIHKSRYFKKKDGLYLGPGAFVTGLEFATDTKAEVVGKPESSFFMEAMENFSCMPQETVMIGDDARDDIDGAMKVGMQAILVKTGKYRVGDELKMDHPPTAVCDDFSTAVDLILTTVNAT